MTAKAIHLAQFWMNLKSAYDLERCEQQNGAEIRRSVRGALAS